MLTEGPLWVDRLNPRSKANTRCSIKVEALLMRGIRGDEPVQGDGIGLSIVLDIVRSYRGTLSQHAYDLWHPSL
jgi:hypothetical protein